MHHHPSVSKCVYVLVSAVVAFGCSDPASTPSPPATTYHYTEVKPENPVSAIMDAKLLAALKHIDDTAQSSSTTVQARLAKETLARIQAGDVRIDNLQDATPGDFYRMCRDYLLPECMTPIADPSTFMPTPATVAFLTKDLAGYMWGNRIYVTIDEQTDPNVLAATLVHETNHVLNRSECSYYVDLTSQMLDDPKAFAEEYRAFVTEHIFDDATTPSNPLAAHTYAATAVKGYGFMSDITSLVGNAAPETVVVSLLADDGTYGRLIPDAMVWPTGFGVCPGP